eukprot:gene9729-biopygen4295
MQGKQRRHQDGSQVAPEPRGRGSPRPGHPKGAWRGGHSRGTSACAPKTVAVSMRLGPESGGLSSKGIGNSPTDGTIMNFNDEGTRGDWT